MKNSVAPVLSVVIATYNRATMLAECLKFLNAQIVPAQSFEVLIIVDGSTDQTVAMLQASSNTFNMRVLEQPNQGQAAALNRGLQNAFGQYVLFLDDDIAAGPHLIQEHIHAQRTAGGAVVMGRLGITLSRCGDGLAQSIETWWNQHYQRLGESGVLESAFDCYGGNLSAPANQVRATGGFNTTLLRGYDAELAYRLRTAGLALVYASKAAGIQTYNKGWKEIAEDFVKEGVGGVAITRVHPELRQTENIGSFNSAGALSRQLRRFLLALHVPVKPLAWVSSFFPSSGLGAQVHRFLQCYAYWVGVRHAIDDPHLWQTLLQQPAPSRRTR